MRHCEVFLHGDDVTQSDASIGDSEFGQCERIIAGGGVAEGDPSTAERDCCEPTTAKDTAPGCACPPPTPEHASSLYGADRADRDCEAEGRPPTLRRRCREIMGVEAVRGATTRSGWAARAFPPGWLGLSFGSRSSSAGALRAGRGEYLVCSHFNSN